MTEAEAREWQERLRLKSAESLRRSAAQAAERQERARRRAHGLVDRQAARLARLHKSPTDDLFASDLDCTE